MLRRTLATGELRTACCMSAELAVTPGELPGLCDLLVDDGFIPALRRLLHDPSGNGRKQSQLARLLVDCASAMRRVRAAAKVRVESAPRFAPASRDPEVRQALCALVVRIGSHLREGRDAKVTSDASGTESKNAELVRTIGARMAAQADVTGGAAEKLRRAFLPAMLPKDRDQPLPSGLLKLLYAVHGAASALREKDCLELLDFATATEVAKGPRLLAFAELADAGVPPRARDDIVWYLWKLCLCSADADRRAAVRAALDLFARGWRAARAGHRRPLLHAAYIIVMTSDDVRGDDPLRELVNRAVEKAHVIYEDIEAAAQSVHDSDHAAKIESAADIQDEDRDASFDDSRPSCGVAPKKKECPPARPQQDRDRHADLDMIMFFSAKDVPRRIAIEDEAEQLRQRERTDLSSERRLQLRGASSCSVDGLAETALKCIKC